MPSDVRGFAGREAELVGLTVLRANAEANPGAVPVAVISGLAGVGKTALAVHWAHRVVENFPDGQLYANLEGYSHSGVVRSAEQVVRGFLTALGVSPGNCRSTRRSRQRCIAACWPADGCWCCWTTPGTPRRFGRCCRVRPLPGAGDQPGPADRPGGHRGRRAVGAGSAHRRGRGGSAHARIGVRAERNEPPSASWSGSVTGCRWHWSWWRPGGGPAAALAGRVGRAVAHRRGLDGLDAGDHASSVRTALSWSYRLLSESTARLFRLVGGSTDVTLSTAAGASLAGVERRQVRTAFAELADAHLVLERGPDRYGMHDLLRAFAAELSGEQDPTGDRAEARGRLFDHYLHSAHAAAVLLHPHWDPIALPAAVTGSGRRRSATTTRRRPGSPRSVRC
ncbi:hypothetical protein NKG94_13325 [Micromonospora sp. M12]